MNLVGNLLVATAAVVGQAAYNGTCPSSGKCDSSTGKDAGSPCCQLKDTFECCFSSEACIPNVGCRCSKTGQRLERADVPKTMLAVTVSGAAKEEGDWSKVAVVKDHKVPIPGMGQVLIKVAASSVNPVDYKILTSNTLNTVTMLANKTLGFDVSGTVVSTGMGAGSRLKVGDEVWADLGKSGLTRIIELGAWAEYAVAEESQVGLKPKSMSAVDAASMPLVGLTAYQAFKMAGAQRCDNCTIVVTSGSGGTGTVALQLAKSYGASRIITSAGTDNLDLCKSLGATEAYDYHKTTIWEQLGNDTVDIVIDNFNGVGTADLAMPSLKSGGVFLFIPGHGGEASKTPKARVKQVNYGLTDSSNYEDLDALKVLVDKGHLRAVVQEKYELSDIFKALDASKAGHVVGKIGIMMPSANEVIVV